jgi:hypothetical protein
VWMINREFDASPGDALPRARTTVEEQRRIRRMSHRPLQLERIPGRSRSRPDEYTERDDRTRPLHTEGNPRNSAVPPDPRSDMVDEVTAPAQSTKVDPNFNNNTNPDRDAPDEWGRQSFPASDPPQNW